MNTILLCTIISSMYVLENCSHSLKKCWKTRRFRQHLRNSFPVVWPVFLQRPRGKVAEFPCRLENDWNGQEEMWKSKWGIFSTHHFVAGYILESTQDVVSYILCILLALVNFEYFAWSRMSLLLLRFLGILEFKPPKPRQPRHSSQDKPASIWMILKDLRYTPLKINMEHNHGGLVQIIFLSKWVICSLHDNLPVLQGVESSAFFPLAEKSSMSPENWRLENEGFPSWGLTYFQGLWLFFVQ